ncbi:hypothetical protein ATER59S_05468 [Aquamicrobium terrae]
MAKGPLELVTYTGSCDHGCGNRGTQDPRATSIEPNTDTAPNHHFQPGSARPDTIRVLTKC